MTDHKDWLDCWKLAHGVRPNTDESLTAGLARLVSKGSPYLPGYRPTVLDLFSEALRLELELIEAEIDVHTSEPLIWAVTRLESCPV